MNDRQRLCRHVGSLAIDDGGSAAMEYAILAGLITVALVSAISGLSESLLDGAIYIRDELLRITSMLSR
jgi:Flp pilus assembly pilin Flp